MSSSELNAIEQSIARNKEVVAKGNALTRLRKNPDFVKVIGKGYLEQEAIRLVHLKGDQNMQKPERQLAIQAEIDAIGHFVQYLNSVDQFAAMAASSLEDDERTREEIAAEELNK
jgi:hypothetical protein